MAAPPPPPQDRDPPVPLAPLQGPQTDYLTPIAITKDIEAKDKAA